MTSVESDANLHSNIAGLIRHSHFEVFPVDGVEDDLARCFPAGTTVHVMCDDDGPDRSIAAASRIARAGFDAVPHIGCRAVAGRSHLDELVSRMREANISGGFFPGGNGVLAPGHYRSAVELLNELGQIDHGLSRIGVACYPERHREIPDDALLAALLEKQKVATFMSSEICFSASTTVSWLRNVRASGVTLPLLIGVPGPVPVRRLLEATKEYGLASALHYLRRQHGMVSAIVKRKFAPEPLLEGLTQENGADLGMDGLHVFTFQQIAATARWWEDARATHGVN